MTERDILDRLKLAFDKAPIDILDELKARQIVKMSEHDDITRQSRVDSLINRLIPFAAAAAAFIGIFFLWQSQFIWADSQVYFDINPSIVATMNKREQVIDLQGINPDAQEIVDDLEYHGKTIIEVTEELLDQLLEKKYLTETEKYILVSVHNKRDAIALDQRIKIDQAIHMHLESSQIKPVVLLQNLQELDDDQFEPIDASQGRATLIRKLLELAPTIKLDRLRQMTVHELVNIARTFDVDLHKLFESQDFEEIQAEEIHEIEFPEDHDYDDDNDNHDSDSDSEDIDDHGDVDDHDIEEHTDDAHENYDPEHLTIPTAHPSTKSSRISLENAKNIALDRVKGRITDIELDDGTEYEVTILGNEREYHLKISAFTGVITFFESEEMDDDDHDSKGNDEDHD